MPHKFAYTKNSTKNLVPKVGVSVAVKINNNNAAARDAAHFHEYVDNSFVSEMMRK